KAQFVIGRAFDLVLGGSQDAASAGLAGDPRLAEPAATLRRDGPEAFGPERWQAFLAAANFLLQTRKPRRVHEPVDAFMDQVESLADFGRGGQLAAILDELRKARPAAYAERARLVEHKVVQPALEPLIPALARTVLHWTDGGRTDLSIVHDEQSALTERRIRRL